MRLCAAARPAHTHSAVLRKGSAKNSARARELTQVLEIFPEVQHAFAYGSGIFKQPGLYHAANRQGAPMLDFVFAVDDPRKWHDLNIERNTSHYSSLAWLGGRAVECNAEKLGAGVHFNTGVPWNAQIIKYGVIRKDALCRDLNTWDTLYVAGRLQKPVLTLAEDAAVAAASQENWTAALATSLLLLPAHFTVQDLARAVVGLSYLGDVRMGLAEDGGKVDRIASGSLAGLRDIYVPLLQESQIAKSASVRRADTEGWQQDTGEAACCQLLSRLPETVRARMAQRLGLGRETRSLPAGEVAAAAFSTGDHRGLLRASIASIVGQSSRSQAVAGFLMAGATRSAWYVWEKLKKKWSG